MSDTPEPTGEHVTPASYARATLNILEDFNSERESLRATQRAVLNILDDSAADKALAHDTHRATLNLLEDFEAEKLRAEAAHRNLQLEVAERHKAEQEVQAKTLANLELEDALTRLKDAQAQLVQSEKLASLGGMVAGISHEINTPVGVGVTAASTLQARASELRELYQRDALRRSDLERFVTLAGESTDIILRNLQRAAELIQSFKQVAVDQSSGERRHFELKRYIDEVLLSLRPKLKATDHRIEVECPPDIVLDTYPGAIAQILTNFVTNTLIHAFEKRAMGHIRIWVSRAGPAVTLHYSDDGCGIPESNLIRIFDPFFTTKRGKGGSGLGLHIVYNLVTQLLGGTIVARSTLGQGTEFTISLPASVSAQSGGSP